MPEATRVEDTCHVMPGHYVAVAWDLDTTGRKLIDEICQIGGHFLDPVRDETKVDEENTFSQYVMPHRNPNPGARRSFGIKVVSIGRYRMLKDLNSGKILKTKSEVSALQDFISWLGRAKGDSDGVILLCHEPERKVLVPLLLQALYKYNLVSSFSKVVAGFCNTPEAISELGDSARITSLSLRSLCKTVLEDTSLSTASAVDRSRVLVSIMARVTGGGAGVSVDKIVKFSSTVSSEEAQLKFLKNVLGTQGTLRPIFESQLKQKRLVRTRAMDLRRIMAEAGLNYEAAEVAFKKGDIRNKLDATNTPAEDIDEIIKLVENHFNLEKSVNGNSLKNNETGE